MAPAPAPTAPAPTAPAPTALAPIALAPNLMMNTGGLLKMSQTVKVFTFPSHIYNHFNHRKFRGQSRPNTSRVEAGTGAGAASKF
jgi:hypothetical protein